MTFEKRFWSKVEKRGDDECWPWTASVDSRGYGHIRKQGKTARSHRVSWELRNGPIPSGEHYGTTCVLHKCDNPLCVNPNHLFLGSVLDNNKDRTKKGRGNKGQSFNVGSNSGRAKLEDHNIIEIRRMAACGNSKKWLANLYKVSYGQICQISNGQSWGHI